MFARKVTSEEKTRLEKPSKDSPPRKSIPRSLIEFFKMDILTSLVSSYVKEFSMEIIFRSVNILNKNARSYANEISLIRIKNETELKFQVQTLDSIAQFLLSAN